MEPNKEKRSYQFSADINVKTASNGKELKDGQIEVIVNTGGADRVDEILDIKGLDVSKYKTNPVVGFGHDYGYVSVGMAVDLWKAEDGLHAILQFAREELDFANTLYKLYTNPKDTKKKYMNAFSIGFQPKEVVEVKSEEDGVTKWKFTKSEMLEFSAVFVGADSGALTVASSYGVNEKSFTDVMKGKMNPKDYKEVEVKDIVEKEGRVLSSANAKKIGNAIEVLSEAKEALEAVLKASEKESDEKSGNEVINNAVKINKSASEAIESLNSKANTGKPTGAEKRKIKRLFAIMSQATELGIKEVKEK